MAAEASASSQMIEAGHSVGAYTLTREIGKGSFAVVFQGKASARSSQGSYVEDGEAQASGAIKRPSRVAIKIVTRKKLTSKLLENLEGEISILRTVRHANIVELLDCLKTSSHIYLIMEFCRMGDLSNFIKTRIKGKGEKPGGGQSAQGRSRGGTDLPDAFLDEMEARYTHPADGGLHDAFARSFLAQLADALQFMRARNIVHRDIKPQNLLLQEPEPSMIAAGHPPFIPQVKVADFGFARHLEAASLAETLCGSPLYMAPEILRYEKYDAKADLWSVGAVLFEMCIGKPPFRASNHVELLRKIERGEDRIKFPDERSDDSLKREHLKRVEEGRAQMSDYIRPHEVPDDLKDLIRALLKRHPVERLGFEDFFNCHLLRQHKQDMERAAPSRDSSLSKSKASNASLRSSSVVPVATRPAPAPPANVEPVRADSRLVEPVPSPRASTAPQAPEFTQKTPTKPAAAAPRPYFAPRYVVGGSDASLVPSPKDQKSEQQARQRARASRRSSAVVDEHGDGEASSLEENALETPGSSVTHLPNTAAKTPGIAAAPQGGSKPGSLYDEERGYVMVDKKSIDANAVAEDYSNQAKRPGVGGVWSPLGVVRRPSQLGRLASLGAFSAASAAGAVTAMATGASQAQAALPARTSPQALTKSPTAQASSPRPVVSSSPRQGPAGASPSSLKLSSTPPGAPFALPRGVRRPSFHSRQSQNSDGSRLTPPSARQQIVPASAPTTGREVLRGPAGTPTSQPPHPSSALARAISMASIRLFGVPTSMSMRASGARRPLRLGALSSSPLQGNEMLSAGSASGSHLSYSEINLLHHLHEYGQKSFVLSEFADAKLSTHFTEGPHQSNYTGPRGASTTAVAGVASTAEKSASPSPNLASSDSSKKPSVSQVAASEALVLYVRSLGYLQRGIDIVREYVDVHAASASRYAYGGTTSASSSAFQPVVEITETVQWLHAKFNDGLERANFARGKAADELPDTARNVDKMIFDKAIDIARTAALDELAHRAPSNSTTSLGAATAADGARTSSSLAQEPRTASNVATYQCRGAGWNIEHCLLAYETASSMLMGLLDRPTSNDESDHIDGANNASDLNPTAFKTVETFARSIHKRIAHLQQQYESVSLPSAVVGPLPRKVAGAANSKVVAT